MGKTFGTLGLLARRRPWTATIVVIAGLSLVVVLADQVMWRQRALPPIVHPFEQRSTLPDFRAISDASERKVAFQDFLHPIIASENDHQQALRAAVLRLREQVRRDNGLSDREKKWLTAMARHYRAGEPPAGKDDWEPLLAHVDTVSASLALAQAALESGWGTSRFAREGLNLFGQWCFKPGCGLTPKRRRSQHLHEVARYDSAEEAVRRYIHNLNTLPAYQPLRHIRAAARQKDQAPDGLTLAAGLVAYSEQRELYVQKVRHMILANDLQRFDHPRH